MAHKAYKLSQRIAIESQLLAEEKWIIDALTKIKNQRNCLQIERLHLESLKAQKTQVNSSTVKKDRDAEKVKEDMNLRSITAVNLMQPVATVNSANMLDCDLPTGSVLDMESTCNDEELNLSITNPVFSSNRDHCSLNMEEEEEEDETCDNILLDMNMFMNGLKQ